MLIPLSCLELSSALDLISISLEAVLHLLIASDSIWGNLPSGSFDFESPTSLTSPISATSAKPSEVCKSFNQLLPIIFEALHSNIRVVWLCVLKVSPLSKSLRQQKHLGAQERSLYTLVLVQMIRNKLLSAKMHS